MGCQMDGPYLHKKKQKMESLKSVNSVWLPVKTDKLWEILTQPAWTEKYLFNCRIVSTLMLDSAMDWVGEYQGQQMKLTGRILEINPPLLLKYSIIDPNLYDASVMENFLHIAYLLRSQKQGTLFTVVSETFDGNEERLKHVVQGWEALVFPTLNTLITA